MAAKKYDPMFPIELVEKDFSYGLKLAENLKLKTPVLEAVRSVYAKAKVQGYGWDNIVNAEHRGPEFPFFLSVSFA